MKFIFSLQKMKGEDNFFLRSSSLNDICLYLKQKSLDSPQEGVWFFMLSLVRSPLWWRFKIRYCTFPKRLSGPQKSNFVVSGPIWIIFISLTCKFDGDSKSDIVLSPKDCLDHIHTLDRVGELLKILVFIFWKFTIPFFNDYMTKWLIRLSF